MNQETFAKEVEVDQSVVSDWERGEYAPSFESYAKLTTLASRHNLSSEALWFMGQVGASMQEFVSTFVKERNAVYSSALIEAQSKFPNDAAAQHRFATAQADRVMRMRVSKRPRS